MVRIRTRLFGSAVLLLMAYFCYKYGSGADFTAINYGRSVSFSPEDGRKDNSFFNSNHITSKDNNGKDNHGRLNYSGDITSMSRFIHFNVTRDDETECARKHFIIYTCGTVCGGWGDRLKGITGLFLLAQLTNRTLLIDMPSPCDINNFVLPNQYDWNKCLPTAKHIDEEKAIQLKVMDSAKRFNVTEFVSGKLKRYQVIRIQSNVMLFEVMKNNPITKYTMPWLNTFTVAQVTGTILGLLFKPTANIQQEVESFYKEKVRGKILVCSHIRYGPNPSIPIDAIRDGHPNVELVLNFLKTYDYKNNVIFVATDSSNIRNQSKQLLSNYVSTEKQIVHIDKTKRNTDTACNGFFTVILEQLILSTCDVLVLTRSNLGTMAAYMRGHSNNIFLHFKGRNDIFKVNLSEIQKTYKFI